MGQPAQPRIGTSGWIYRHWRGVFYPQRLAVKDWFSYYAARFDTVEINNSFYRLQSPEAYQGWAEQAGPGFVYAVKGSRFLTHLKKLKDPEQPLELMLGRARLLGSHLGPILYQLPPRWRCDLDRLRAFLKLLPRDLLHVIELRDPSWYNDAVRDALVEKKVCFCMHDLRGEPCPDWVTGPAVYVRFHGPTQRAYAGGYSTAHLQGWADRLAGYLEEGRAVYAYFNNDDSGHAVANALKLRELLDSRVMAIRGA